MKKVIAITSLALSCAAMVPASNAETTAIKQGTVFTTSTIAGAVIGGPVGFILGALGGAYMGEQIEKADHLEATEWQLSESEAQIVQLHGQLADARLVADDLAKVALQSLEFQVLFHTGEDHLTDRDLVRVEALGNYLEKNPSANVRLVGHADPRGTDEYNNVLSDQRALAVQNALERYGISSDRIERRAYGSAHSTAKNGDREAYALERRVDIEIYNPTAENLAQLN
jgi:outer membrane protein OmpA-like peptidoglycan-associated protein